MLDLLVKGDVVLGHGVARDGAVGVVDGKVAGLYASPSAAPAAKETVDAQGCLIYPGMVDVHVHCHSNQAETIELATQAAAAGGVTTILDMPYDIGAPVNTVEIFRAQGDRDPPGRPRGRGHAGNAAKARRGRGGGAAGARGGLRLQDERLRDRPRPLPAHRRPRPLAGPARDRPPWRARRVPRGDRPHHRGPDRPGQAGRPDGCHGPLRDPAARQRDAGHPEAPGAGLLDQGEAAHLPHLAAPLGGDGPVVQGARGGRLRRDVSALPPAGRRARPAARQGLRQDQPQHPQAAGAGRAVGASAGGAGGRHRVRPRAVAAGSQDQGEHLRQRLRARRGWRRAFP